MLLANRVHSTDKTEFTSTNVGTPKILHIAFASILYPKPNPGETWVSTIEIFDQPEYRYIPDTVLYYQCSYSLVAAIYMKPGHYVSILRVPTGGLYYYDGMVSKSTSIHVL